MRLRTPGSGSTQPQLQLERLYLNLDMRSMLRLAPVVEAFERFALFLQLRNGEITFDDRPVDRVHKVSAFTLTLPFLSNLPTDVQIKLEPRLAFVVDGSAFDIGGQSTPFADGRASEFKLRIDKLQLQPWWAYLPRQLPVRAAGGVVDTDLTLRFEQRAQGDSHVVLQGDLQLADLALRDGDDAALLEWRRLALKLTEANAQSEATAMQRAALEQRILDEQRRDRARGSMGSAAAADAPLPPLTPEQRAQIVTALYTQTELPGKPRNAVGLLQGLPLADTEALLAAAVPVGEAAARALAVQRARVMREAFIDKGLSSERLFLAEPNANPASADNAALQPQALLTVAPK